MSLISVHSSPVAMIQVLHQFLELQLFLRPLLLLHKKVVVEELVE